MGRYVLSLEEIDRTQIAVVGGKGANLGEVMRIEGIGVPAGLCVTTEAFERIMADALSLDGQLDPLARLKADDRERIRTLSAGVRRTIEGIAIPDDLAEAMVRQVARLGEHVAYAVRSSATAEDLPTASFAGAAGHVSERRGAGSDPRAREQVLGVALHRARCDLPPAQRIRPPEGQDGGGHTGDGFPAGGRHSIHGGSRPRNRKVTSVAATFAPGAALVSRLVNAHVYKVRDGDVVSRAVRQEQPVLTDAQILRLAQLGRSIEAHFGRPQDIEWCLVDDVFHVVQARPITTLFPIPAAVDEENHVYVSVRHQPMMTDAMKPLGLSVWQLTTPRPMAEAAGRLFVDVTQALASPASRAGLMRLVGQSDPLIGDSLQTILERGNFI